jgi:molybdate transport system permease protein
MTVTSPRPVRLRRARSPHGRGIRSAVDVAPRVPWPLAVPAAVAVVFLLLPLAGLLLRASWRDLPRLLLESEA